MAPPFLTSHRWPLGRRLALLTGVLLFGASLAVAVAVDAVIELDPGPYRYNLAAYEARNFPAKWLYEVGELLRADRSEDQQDADIARFFELTRQINALERKDAADAAELQSLRRERDRLENRVEDSLEGRLSAVLKDFGLTRKLAILPRLVWPPVDFEITDAPRSLATSPRERIELLGSELLREDLDLEEIEAIEADTEERKGLSALAAPTAGIGAYPAIVDYLSSYQSTLEVAAHEWTHNYLFFSPLGFNYYDNNDLRTMNETVADLVGHEVSAEVLRRWPVRETALRQPDSSPSSLPPVDLGVELRRLRGEVDALLAQGKVQEAEALMEARRLELASQGVFIRKINQAYFAFSNLYAGEAGSPAATNPIGPKIDELRRRSSSLSAFVALVSGLTSVAQLDAALATQP